MFELAGEVAKSFGAPGLWRDIRITSTRLALLGQGGHLSQSKRDNDIDCSRQEFAGREYLQQAFCRSYESSLRYHLVSCPYPDEGLGRKRSSKYQLSYILAAVSPRYGHVCEAIVSETLHGKDHTYDHECKLVAMFSVTGPSGTSQRNTNTFNGHGELNDCGCQLESIFQHCECLNPC